MVRNEARLPFVEGALAFLGCLNPSLELYSSQEFDHAAGVGSLRITEVLVIDIGAGIRISVSDRLKLKSVERVIHVCLKTQQGMAFAKVVRKLLGETDVEIFVARSAEAVAPDAGDIGVRVCGWRDIEIVDAAGCATCAAIGKI